MEGRRDRSSRSKGRETVEQGPEARGIREIEGDERGGEGMQDAKNNSQT